jgi:hypothetical protein
MKAGTRDDSLLHSVHTHASVLLQGHSPGVKRPELGTDNSLDLLSMLPFFVTILKLTCGLHKVILRALHNVDAIWKAHPASYVTGEEAVFPVTKRREVGLTTHLHPTSRLRMNGAMFSLSTRLHDSNKFPFTFTAVNTQASPVQKHPY